MQGRPAYLNRTRIVPAVIEPEALGLMEQFDYMASLLVFAEEFTGWPQLCDALNAGLERMPELRGGASVLAHGGCVARFLARSASDITGGSQKLWNAAREALLGLPPFEHRKY
jgi:urease accessory protein UreH